MRRADPSEGKGMIRDLLTIASVMLLLLCLAAAVLWVRSYARNEAITFHSGGGKSTLRGVSLCSWHGSLFLAFNSTVRTPSWPESRPSVRFISEQTTQQRFAMTLRVMPRPAGATRWPPIAGVTNEVIVQQWNWEHLWLSLGSYSVDRSYDLNHGKFRTVNHVAGAILPHWLACLVLGLLPGIRMFRWMRVAQRRRMTLPGHCLSCGYDLRASTGRCSECGTPIRVGAG